MTPTGPTVGLFVTCLVDAIRPRIGFATLRLLEEAGCRVEVPRVAEGTAWGAACLAGVQAGVFSSLAESAKAWHAAQIYEPRLDEAHAEDLYDGWVEAVAKTRFVRA